MSLLLDRFALFYPMRIVATAFMVIMFDSFVVGIVVHAIGFAPLPTFVLITVALASALSVDGLRQMPISAGSVLGDCCRR